MHTTTSEQFDLFSFCCSANPLGWPDVLAMSPLKRMRQAEWSANSGFGSSAKDKQPNTSQQGFKPFAFTRTQCEYLCIFRTTVWRPFGMYIPALAFVSQAFSATPTNSRGQTRGLSAKKAGASASEARGDFRRRPWRHGLASGAGAAS